MLNVKEINRNRLRAWEQEMNNDHATPAICIAVGHDHKLGQIHFYYPDKFPFEQILTILKNTVEMIEKGQTKDGGEKNG